MFTAIEDTPSETLIKELERRGFPIFHLFSGDNQYPQHMEDYRGVFTSVRAALEYVLRHRLVDDWYSVLTINPETGRLEELTGGCVAFVSDLL